MNNRAGRLIKNLSGANAEPFDRNNVYTSI